MNDLEKLQDMMISFLALENKDNRVSRKLIEETIEELSSSSLFGTKITKEEKDELVKFLESQFDVNMNIGSVIQEDFEPWLDSAKVSINPYYWGKYRKLLGQKGFGLRVIPKLDQITDKTLGLLENPKKHGSWERKGMVVGKVQSGKTANYTGLISKAADAGYKLIIVIAGIHNNLRSQTQKRIDEGFVGKDSSQLLNIGQNRDRFIGVGKFGKHLSPITLTNTVADFDKHTADKLGLALHNVNVPIILVIKKNYRTLENLIAWLKGHSAVTESGIAEHSMLMIDDEADNASINTSADPNESTRINSLLREILDLFQKQCYIGYTATPFANIFIDPDSEEQMLNGGGDLFPRDFIVSLDAPDNYIGPEKIFGQDADLDIIRTIDDYEDILPIKHKIDDEITALPPSMYEALYLFILVLTIRNLRKQSGKHNSMLINCSRFTNIQTKIKDQIHEKLTDTVNQIRFNFKKPIKSALKNKTMTELFLIWEKEFSNLELKFRVWLI